MASASFIATTKRERTVLKTLVVVLHGLYDDKFVYTKTDYGYDIKFYDDNIGHEVQRLITKIGKDL